MPGPIGIIFFKVLSDPKNVGRLCNMFGQMPNIETKTLGGHVFWETLGESGGWKLQKNKFTDHCRILDPEDARKAWGSEESMREILNKCL